MVSLQNFLQLEDFNGVPLAAGKVYVYHQGRTELAEIYSDINGETPIANPAILDDLGMQNIYVSNVYNYTVVVTDPYNNELFTREIYPNGVDGDGNNRLYEGLDPICVNNEKLVISAKKATLSVQDPLYFVEDSPSAVCIGLQESAYSGLPYVENSALGYGMAGMQPYVSSISGLGLYALSAGSATLADSASISYSAENAGLVTSGWETGSDGRITAYNGTAFSAGKVYSGVSPVWVNNDTDQIGVSSKDFLANSPLYFTEYSDRVELSISGLPPTPGLMYESGFNYESGKITGYNNSGISAGKVYSGISPITVDNVNDTISVASATLGVQAPLFFVEDSESATVIGLNTAQIHVDIPESANWNEVYSTVNNNSGSWTSAADELAVLNTAKWEEASNALSSNSADWNSVNDKLDKSALELTGEYVSGIELGGTSYRLYAGWSTEASIAQTANFDSEGNYIVEYVNAIKNNSGDWNNVSAKLDSTASANFLTAHQSLTASANWDSTYDTVSNNSASWTTPTYSYTDNDLISAIDISGLYATSALEAVSANVVKDHGILGYDLSSYLTQNTSYFYWMPANSPWTTADYATGIFAPLQYSTGACLAMNNPATFKGFYKGNEWFIANTVSTVGQMLRGEVHRTRGVHISGATTAGYGFNLSINNVSGVDSVGSWKYGHAEDAALRAVSSCDMHESAFDYDASNNITAYNGSAFKAGDEFPQSATDAIDVVTGGSANWNSTTATVATNSGAWGGSGIEISAGFGIDIQMVDNKLVISLATATGAI